MKIQQYTPVEENTIGDFKEIESGIRSSDLGFALNAVSKNLYSNPIGSFIRELVSNAVDANKDNNSSEPVLVEISQEDGNWYFSVKDYGKGLSEEQFSNIYMNWFNSNKRDSNNLIGGFGLGSKSPLSYTDNYEFITIHEGIEYSYSIYKTKDVPRATLLNKVNNELEVGTIVKFEVKETDLWKINQECKKQLLYFDNVIVKDRKYHFDNNFNVLESELFKYRTNNTAVDKLHISLGNVPYEIDFSLLQISQIYIPIAIKFETGELPVVLSRESINYEDENIDVINVIKERLFTVVEDIKERYEKQVNFTNFKEYLDFLFEENKYLKLGEFKVKIDKDVVNNIKGKLAIKEYTFKLSKERLNKISELVYTSGVVKSVKKNDITISDIRRYTQVIIKDSKTNKFSEQHFKGKVYIKFKDYSRNLLETIAEELDILGSENWLLVSSFIYKGIKDFITSKSYGMYSQYPKYIEEKITKEVKEKTDYITTYTSSNSKEQLGYNILNSYKYIFYIIKDDKTDYVKIANYEKLFSTFPAYFKTQLLLIVVSPTVITKYKKDKRFKEVEVVWSYKKLYNHFNRLLITNRFKELDIHYGINDISRYYAKLYYDLRTVYNYQLIDTVSVFQPSKYSPTKIEKDINIIKYFNIQLNLRKNDKHYQLIDKLEELEKVKDFLHLYLLVESNKGKEHYKEIFKYIKKQSKLTKLNY